MKIIATTHSKCANVNCENFPSQGKFALVKIGEVTLWLCMPCAIGIGMQESAQESDQQPAREL